MRRMVRLYTDYLDIFYYSDEFAESPDLTVLFRNAPSLPGYLEGFDI